MSIFQDVIIYYYFLKPTADGQLDITLISKVLRSEAEITEVRDRILAFDKLLQFYVRAILWHILCRRPTTPGSRSASMPSSLVICVRRAVRAASTWLSLNLTPRARAAKRRNGNRSAPARRGAHSLPSSAQTKLLLMCSILQVLYKFFVNAAWFS